MGYSTRRLDRKPTIKSELDLQRMRDAAKINVEVLQTIWEAIKPGVTTWELDQIAYDIIVNKYGAVPAFLNYPPGSRHPFPATITASINEELVHGIPSKKRVLKDGDLISIDCGTIYKGYVADSAFSKGVGQLDEEASNLLRVTNESLDRAIEQALPGNRVSDISHATQKHAEKHGFNVPRQYGGHGVGKKMHEEPHIPNWGKPGKGLRLRPGMTFAIEPMLMAGTHETEVLKDHWTVVSKDRALNAHTEHTVAVTDNGPEILTLWDQ
ncbi:MAG: type I methionyl aminopeptidase [Chloroflexi bacterium]|nr:type I methionyl aminopeptidase [Chloroflexota bacterium]